MKLLEVYRYSSTTTHKFIYKSIDNGYFWYVQNIIVKAGTPVIDSKFKRVLRKDI